MRLSVKKKKMDGTREVHVKRKKNIYFLNTKIVFTLTYGTYEEIHKKMSSIKGEWKDYGNKAVKAETV